MEEDFSNVISKFQDIMKEKDIDLNSILSSSNQSNENYSNNEEPANNSNSNSDFNFDINTILKMKQIFDRLNNTNNPRNTLLYSLKPFLRKDKKEKLDQYIKISNLLSILEIMNNDNM